jgi:drug/metabolite transporter (DMT)-like permease
MHFCVFLWGFTAILGRLITLDALPLVWWRMGLVAFAFFLIPQFWSGVAKLSGRMIAIYAGIGGLVAMHWFAFYGAINLSNASVAVTCMALAPVFVAFVEPLFAGSRFHVRDVVLGLAVIPGVALIVGGTPVGMRAGIAMGVLAALLVSFFSSLNKRFIEKGEALAVTGIEMASGTATLMIIAPFWMSESLFELPARSDMVYLLVLSLVCTALPFALALVALRHLSVFAATLAVNMEPVYAVLLAIVILGEQRELTPMFYAGVAIIFVIVFGHPVLVRTFGSKPLGSQPDSLDTGISDRTAQSEDIHA